MFSIPHSTQRPMDQKSSRPAFVTAPDAARLFQSESLACLSISSSPLRSLCFHGHRHASQTLPSPRNFPPNSILPAQLQMHIQLRLLCVIFPQGAGFSRSIDLLLDWSQLEVFYQAACLLRTPTIIYSVDALRAICLPVTLHDENTCRTLGIRSMDCVRIITNDTRIRRMRSFWRHRRSCIQQIFPALQALTRRGHLDMPVIVVARSGGSLDR